MPHFFAPHPLEADDLLPLGVTIEDAVEPESAHIDPETGLLLVVVGAVMLCRDGTVRIYPRVGAERRPLAMPAMLTKAEDALPGRLEAFGHGRAWSWTTVMLRLDEDDMLGRVLRAAVTQPFDPRDNESRRLKRIPELQP